MNTDFSLLAIQRSLSDTIRRGAFGAAEETEAGVQDDDGSGQSIDAIPCVIHSP